MPSPPVWIMVGTRPEAIKLAPVVHALEAVGLPPLILLSGQHPHLDLAAFGIAARPSLQLSCPGRPDPQAYAADVCRALAPLLVAHAPAILLVQGDTSSALGGALAGFATATPVGHVEAGLRTFDPALPWPEENNRVTIDAQADLLFAPTELSAENLRREQVPGSIHVTGNSAIDALAELVGPLPAARPLAVASDQRLLVTCHRRENWGTAFLPVARALLELAAAPKRRIDVVLHPNPAQAETMRTMLGGERNIRLLPPMTHAAMVQAMRRATLVLSDSGGVQEEAPALGVPLLVLREKTERPEGIATGNMRLVGTSTEAIVTAGGALLADPAALAAMALPALPFGDGHAAPRIARLLADWLAAGDGMADRLTA